MARSLTTIKAEMTTSFMNNEVLSQRYGFAVGASFDDEFSLVSLENILFSIVALAIFLMDRLFDTHKAEVDEKIRTQKSGGLPWYRFMALEFMYGFDLVTDHDYFDLTGATAEEIAAAKIVKYAAVAEAEESSRVIIKIAGETGGVLAPITDEQKEAFDAYINEVRFAGVQCTVINFLPDQLYLTIQIQYDPLVLNAQGQSILNANYPVNDALQEYMKQLPFNGELRLNHVIDKLQGVPGVIDATILSAESTWIDADTEGYGDPQQINVAVIPESGYFEIVTFDNITYVV